MNDVVIDPEKQRKAKQYARISRRLMLLDLLLGGVYLLVWLFSGWSIQLREALSRITTNPWLQVPLFILVLGGIYYIINLPLSFYSGYILPHRFGMSNQTPQGWVSDEIKGLLVSGMIGGILLEVVYWVLREFPDTWWLWAGGFMLLFTVLLANLAPVVLMPLFYKFIPLGEEHADLAARLTRLAENAGARVRGVFTFDMSRRTKAANAALTGLGSSRRIILGDTLVSEFTADEIETVMAHELGHHVHKDIPWSILLESVITLVGLFLASVALKWGAGTFGFSGPSDLAAMPLFAIVIALFGLITMPVTNAYSRWRERRADAYALEATGHGKEYASALSRLANQNLAEAEPEPWVEFLLYSHPALNKRIAMAEKYKNGHHAR